MQLSAVQEFHRDDRGAVMLTGLGFSLFLTGALWYIVGTSNAIMVKQGLQEATDQGAFTSAVMHAKGMNFISMLNMIVLILIVIHIVMGLIHDILLVGCFFIIGCPNYLEWKPKWNKYASFMRPVAKSLHYVEQAVAFGYPFLAAYKASLLGDKYGTPKWMQEAEPTVLALSPSLIAGTGLVPAVNNAYGPEATKPPPVPLKSYFLDDNKATIKLGLPVEEHDNRRFCSMLASFGLDTFVGLTGMSMPDYFNTFMRVTMNGPAGALAGRYCNSMTTAEDAANLQKLIEFNQGGTKLFEEMLKDKLGPFGQIFGWISGFKVMISQIINQLLMQLLGPVVTQLGDPGINEFWAEEGPHTPWHGMTNGSVWNDVFTLTPAKNVKDAGRRVVALAGRKFNVPTKLEQTFKFAQAESYFDCLSSWEDPDCNGTVGTDDKAGYSIKWRGRLKQSDLSRGFKSLIKGSLASFLVNLAAPVQYQELKKVIAKTLGEYVADGLGTQALDQLLGRAFSEIEGPIQSRANALPVPVSLDFGALH